MKPHSIALIGYGGFGKFLHQGWKQLQEVQVVAIADQQASKIPDQDGLFITSDWQELLTRPEIELIAIVTPPNTHEAIATACMQAGKHVLIEKPLALSMSSARKIIQIRDATQSVAGIDFIMRFNPLIREIRKLTRQGAFGQLRRVDVENYAQDEQLPPDHWFWDIEQSGGILVEHGVHFMDLVHFINPEHTRMQAVSGLKHNRNPQLEDQILANILYNDGLIATHYHAFSRPGFFEKTKIKLAFDLADLELHGWIPLSAEVNMLVHAQTKQAMLQSPFFQSTNSLPIDQMPDESRPAGWGIAKNSDTPHRSIRSGGITYEVEEVLTGKLDLGRSKEAVYTQCVQDSLLDLLYKIEKPAHELTAPLEAALPSLEIALQASFSARNK